jgi:hypothetical protein
MAYVSILIIDITAQFLLLLCDGEYEESRKITASRKFTYNMNSDPAPPLLTPLPTCTAIGNFC